MVVYTNRHRVPFEVDEEDYVVVVQRTWHLHPKGYPATHVRVDGKDRTITLHLFLLGTAPAGLEWDHHDRNKRNNRRSNLRAVPPVVNLRNVGLRRDNTSGIRGVSWSMRYQCWRASISTGRGESKHLGYFSNKADAASARLVAEAELWR